MPEIRDRMLDTPHSGIRRMLEHARQVDSPVMLVNGDPNFSTPAHIVESAADRALHGSTGYSPGEGRLDLREAVAEKILRVNDFNVDADEVCITTGACGGLYTSLLLLVGPGDEVLVPNPGWSNYAAIVHVLGGTAKPYPLRPDADWTLDAEALLAAITPRTRAILVNSPSNPTGSVEDREGLLQVLEIAERHDLWVISDEAYDELVFDVCGTSLASLGGQERVITVFTFSKSYAMTGWRVGYVSGPRQLIRQLGLHQEPVVSCTSTISQHAALAALRGPQDCVKSMVDAYDRRRLMLARTLTDAGVPFVLPRGAFFVMVDIRPTGLDSWDYALRLLREAGVGTVPGAAFGTGGEGFVRVTLAAADEVLAEGMARLTSTYRAMAG